MFLEAASDWYDRDCETVFPTAQEGGLTWAICLQTLLSMTSTGEKLHDELDNAKPWPSELSSLADSTSRNLNYFTGIAGMMHAEKMSGPYTAEDMTTLHTNILPAVDDLKSWTPYMGGG